MTHQFVLAKSPWPAHQSKENVLSRFSYKRAEVFAGYTIPAALKKAPRTPCLTVTKSDLSDILGTGKLYQDHIKSRPEDCVGRGRRNGKSGRSRRLFRPRVDRTRRSVEALVTQGGPQDDR